MKLNNSKTKDDFQKQLQTFKSLLKGSVMAKLSCFIIIIVSLKIIYLSRDQTLEVVLLSIGILGLAYYMIKYLSLIGIKQKSYTQTSLISSISTFKSYMKKRKKYEMYFMSFWMLSILPFAISFLELKGQAILVTICYIAVSSYFGNLAYKKVDKIVEGLETEMEIINRF
ncbi:hypothetical protein WNY78_09470 [Psychroserpens sp. AS72]|uniref:hypothetical protein n=1 Tax=Psychroserpens sp. AS72 TaxID=3135775 RepID=UPI00316E05D6